ncbi:MAG: hypothetical protein DME05_10080 [Candidatus Rokuibacteriota bacterium]|nr:MAG: hypothetical protein DME05_10080 [Candidatus Rokubacteria bacterium]
MLKMTARVRAPSASRTLSVYGMEMSARPWAISTRPRRRAIAGNGESRSRAARAPGDSRARRPSSASGRRL